MTKNQTGQRIRCNTAFIFGDGAGAVVVGPSEDNGISPAVWGSDGENSDAISENYDIPEYMDRAEEFQSKDSETDPVGRMVVAMQGTRVFRWAAITLPKALSSVIERSGRHPGTRPSGSQLLDPTPPENGSFRPT